MAPRFCTCSVPSVERVEGVELCSDCGERIPDPRDQTRDELLRLVVRQQQAIIARLDRLEDRDEGSATDRLLEPAELARRLGLSRQFVYDHSQELGAIRLGRGRRPRLFFDLATARERLAARSARNGSSPSKPKARNRKRRSSANVELLPIGRRSP